MGEIPRVTQDKLFYEDVFDVLRAAVQHAGGPKKVSGLLWPTKPERKAHTELLDCLNPDSDRKLCILELMAVLTMARAAGFHQAKHWIDNALGYQPTPPADPIVERDRLAEQMAKMTEAFKEMTRAAERLNETKLTVAK